MSGAIFKIKLTYVKTVFQFVHGFLDAKSVVKDNIKLFCMKFASQISLDTVFLVELTSSIHLATLKIVKSLMVSEFGSSSAVVALHDVLLDMFAVNIKTALSVFGIVVHVVLKSASIWQYVVVYFEKLDSAVFALNHWSVLVDKNSIRIFFLVNQNKTILFCNRFKAKLVNLSFGCTAFKISDMISQVETLGHWHCFRCQKMDHLAVNCEIFPLLFLKTLKLFKSHFLISLESDLAKLSVLVESIVKPVGFLVKVFEQFINGIWFRVVNLALKLMKF
ncbi:hypothetical protein G9A89_001421 [Geosiphon pyriformis]|nr:hypothetical protein G9A89_001421 [Geosiphon pyriformis]